MNNSGLLKAQEREPEDGIARHWREEQEKVQQGAIERSTGLENRFSNDYTVVLDPECSICRRVVYEGEPHDHPCE